MKKLLFLTIRWELHCIIVEKVGTDLKDSNARIQKHFATFPQKQKKLRTLLAFLIDSCSNVILLGIVLNVESSVKFYLKSFLQGKIPSVLFCIRMVPKVGLNKVFVRKDYCYLNIEREMV